MVLVVRTAVFTGGGVPFTNRRTVVWFKLIGVLEARPSSVLTCDNDIVPDAGNVISTPYGVPYAVESARAMKLPDESIEAILVAPYLKYNLPPDSTILKFVVATLPALPVVF